MRNESFREVNQVLFYTNADKIATGDIYRFIKEQDSIRVYNGTLYFYQQQYSTWTAINLEKEGMVLRQHIDPTIFFMISSYKIKEVGNMLRDDPELQHDFECNTVIRNKINLLNGVYDIEKKELLPHDKEYYFNYYVNINYLPTQKLENAVNFFGYVNTSLGYKIDVDKTQLLFQILGYCISGLEGAKVAFFFLGKRDSGKSQLMELLKIVIGEQYITNIPFHKLGGTFNIARLSKSRLNICTEIKKKSMPDAELFKAIVSHDRISGEFKGKNPFDFNVKTKLISVGNAMPCIGEADGTDAVFRRLIFLMFNVSTPREKWDLKLLDKLIKEKDIIFSLAIDKLTELIENKYQFVQPDDSKRFAEQYENSQNALQDFIENCCTIQENYRIHIKDLYSAYEKYCRDNCYLITLDSYSFSQSIDSIEGIIRSRFRENGQSLHGFKGIGLKK